MRRLRGSGLYRSLPYSPPPRVQFPPSRLMGLAAWYGTGLRPRRADSLRRGVGQERAGLETRPGPKGSFISIAPRRSECQSGRGSTVLSTVWPSRPMSRVSGSQWPDGTDARRGGRISQAGPLRPVDVDLGGHAAQPGPDRSVQYAVRNPRRVRPLRAIAVRSWRSRWPRW